MAVASNFYIWLGFILYAFGAMLWLAVLARVDVGIAYPFVGVGIILTAFAGVFVLGEVFTVIRFVGICVVALGLVLVTYKYY